jgi:uncharacterized protein YrrD
MKDITGARHIAHKVETINIQKDVFIKSHGLILK